MFVFVFVSDRWRKTTVVYDFLAACKNILTIFSLFQLCSNRTVSSLFFFFALSFVSIKLFPFGNVTFKMKIMFQFFVAHRMILYVCSIAHSVIIYFTALFSRKFFFSFFQYFRFVYCGACVCVFYFFFRFFILFCKLRREY